VQHKVSPKSLKLPIEMAEAELNSDQGSLTIFKVGVRNFPPRKTSVSTETVSSPFF